ncbi:hypothetical protein KUCAC02_013880 [Chaenocephalus aceratus]|uniref:Uncharacterized protein n=1 Tax=Chaenocephalus aceratus TaxID=36190 RepID=A0ACB9WCC5_CHAAC|nr:hypothetical protein KUCAC02_013880 [Chaenocephalus aceratus]
MEDDGRYRDGRSDFVRGAKDIAKVAKKQVGKKMGRGADKVADEYTKRSYKRFEEEDDDDDYGGMPASNDDGYHRNDSRANDDEGHSDSTEGHDEDDEIYEGEYQGIPEPSRGRRAAWTAWRPPRRSSGICRPTRRRGGRTRRSWPSSTRPSCRSAATGSSSGRFTSHWAWRLMADGVEIFVVGFVLPSAEKDMCLSEPNKGMLPDEARADRLSFAANPMGCGVAIPIEWRHKLHLTGCCCEEKNKLQEAGLIVYLGMMVGAFVWGGLADRIGRRQTLLISLSINSVFAFFSSFMQGYVSFLFCRLASGVGIGGSIPIVFSYYSEFLAQEKRGEHLSWLCMFWMIGGIYASAMAWAIIPHYGWSFQMGSAYQFHSWRVFVLVCAFPAVAAISALTIMPESPRFYLENGKHDEAWMILKQVHDTNMKAKGYPERVFSVWSNFLTVFSPEYRRTTYMMMAVWFSMSFSYYGLTVWFPDMIKYLQKQDYASRTKFFCQGENRTCHLNFTLENQVHRQGEYFNDKFMNLKMRSMVFEDSLFEECYFEDITSSNTFFKNCTFIATLFYNTDLFKYRLVNSKLINALSCTTKRGCLLSDATSSPALLMDKIGRLRMLAGSSVISCISCFFCPLGNSESAMIALLCLFGGISIASWNALDVLTVELYPSDKRCTAFGFLNALCKLAAILGISIFTSFVGITKAVPIIFAAGALAAGSFWPSNYRRRGVSYWGIGEHYYMLALSTKMLCWLNNDTGLNS